MESSPDRVVAGLIGERYEITGLIASGGMGSVYRARDTVLDRIVALKVLKGGTDDPAFAARFRAEATNAARLSHPNVVQVYDFGYADDTPYMAMEFVDGQTLREVLTERGHLSPPLAARIASQVASALEHARRNGIIHRDVKPENILLTTDGMVKVADFGLSRALAESNATQAGVLFGTAHYLSPEQIQGGMVDHRSDIYSLGVVLYEMLTGRPPFEGDSPVVIAYKRVAEDVPSILEVDDSLPHELDVIVIGATARDPDDRYPTAGVMGEALRASSGRADTGDLGVLVHHTEAIPLHGQDTIVIARRHDRARTTAAIAEAREPQPKGERKRRGRKLATLVLALLVVAGATLAAATQLMRAEVPQVVGETQPRAAALLRDAGFSVDVRLEHHADVLDEHVIAQSPAPGEVLRRGQEVQIVVSLGPAVADVPDLRGEKFADAETELRELGFLVKRVDVFHGKVPKLGVVSQDPEGGTILEKGETVTLNVSKGPEMVSVPNVVGDPSASAQQDLKDVGFAVRIVERNHDTVAAGRVIAQSPSAGTKAEKGSRVTLTVSKGPVTVAVPNIRCMTRSQAADVLAGAGLKIEYSGRQRMVVDQSPGAGQRAPKGSTVTAYMGPGTSC